MPPEPGAIVGDRYRLEEVLASGGMGSVWRARHVELDTLVAVKLMSAELLSSEHGEKRFRREAQAAARLKSPHIVKVFDFGTFEGQPYLAMELLDGEDLSARLAAQGSLSLAQTLQVVEAVAKALEVAHAAEIVHRDLKPANIFLERVGGDEVVKVLDFGIAKELGASAQATTTGGAIVGSPAYMSPEQVWGEAIGVRSDLWALGVVTYEMLTGVSPFAHEMLAQVFDRIIKAKVPSPSSLNAALPSGLDAFFERALSRDAAGRFGTPRELVAALRAALAPRAEETAETLAAPAPARAPGVAPGRPARIVTVALVLGVMIIGFSVARRVSREHDAGAPSPLSASAPALPVPSASPAPTAPPPPSASASAEAAPPSVSSGPRPKLAPVRSAPPATSARGKVMDPKWGVPVEPPPN